MVKGSVGGAESGSDPVSSISMAVFCRTWVGMGKVVSGCAVIYGLYEYGHMIAG